MATVFAKFDNGREWLWLAERVPLTAVNARQCKGRYLEQRGGGASVEVGSLVVECLRNDKGVQATVALPNGYLFPTGRIAPKETWFPMLKAHLRGWLAMSNQGRIVRIVNEGMREIERQFRADLISEDVYRRSVAKLEKHRADALGELPARLSESDLLAAFYNWVTETAAQAQMAQPDVIAIIDRALRTGKTVQVPDLVDEVVRGQDLQRFLDM